MTWLQEKNEFRKQAAVLVLQSLAINAPSQFYVHISDFFKHVWSALSESKLSTRECAANSLKAALELTASRKGRQRLQWHDNIWQQALAVPNFFSFFLPPSSLLFLPFSLIILPILPYYSSPSSLFDKLFIPPLLPYYSSHSSLFDQFIYSSPSPILPFKFLHSITKYI